jgi:hypothetical protein
MRRTEWWSEAHPFCDRVLYPRSKPYATLRDATTAIARKLQREFVTRHSRSNGQQYREYLGPPRSRRTSMTLNLLFKAARVLEAYAFVAMGD